MKDPRRRWLLRRLERYEPFDDGESEMLARLIAFVMAHEDCCDRRLPSGHITASAWVVDRGRERALLVHHGKLDKWLQPGGHIENDPSLIDAARRELEEETGLRKHRLLSGEIFNIDVHPIPAFGGQPKHIHYDIVFVFEASSGARLRVSKESNELRWVPLRDLEQFNDSAAMKRLAAKTGEESRRA